MEKPVIIFDLDGTLADTGPDLIAALNHATRPEGLAELTMTEVGYLVGDGSLAMIRRAFERAGRALDKPLERRLHERFLAYYETNIADHTRLFPGAETLLAALSEKGHPLAVCTNKFEALANRLLTELGIADRFAAVTGGDSFVFRKPDGRHLIETVKRAAGAPMPAIMIGDSATDREAARRAAMPVILADFGYSRKPVATLRPEAVISHFSEVPAALERLMREQPAPASA